MRRVALKAAAPCFFLIAFAACSPNGSGGGGGTGDAGNTATCDGGTVTLTVDVPDCLWAPDHKMVLISLDDVHATVTGSCALPTVSIVGVTSNQPDTGGGQGNFTPDYTFNSTGVCLRSERQGTSDPPRIYTITVEATDGTTTVDQSFQVTVGHSQSGGRCALVDSSRIVDDGDPRCN